MEMYTDAEYADLHLMLGAAGGNAAQAARLYEERYPNRRHPDPRTFTAVDRRLRERGSVRRFGADVGGYRRRDRRDEDILNLVQANPQTSTRAVAAVLHVSQSLVWRCLHTNQLYPYHHQRVQGLERGDYPARIIFCQWYLRQHGIDPLFTSIVLFTDEATFSRDGIFNTHNTHTWAHANPHTTVRRAHQVRYSINVWAGIIGDYIIGPYQLPQRLTGDMYRQFLEETLPVLLEEVPLGVRRRMWFMHDGAPAHFRLTARAYLDTIYPNRWLGRAGPTPWPPRSPDLNPLDFYLWGHLKTLVYATEVQSREDLWRRVCDACEQIKRNPRILERVRESMLRRVQACLEAHGGHFEHFL